MCCRVQEPPRIKVDGLYLWRGKIAVKCVCLLHGGIARCRVLGPRSQLSDLGVWVCGDHVSAFVRDLEEVLVD